MADEGIAIGDVSRITGIPEHTIRYWEKEFADVLSPLRTRGRQRRYSDEDIAMIEKIRALLWTENFSIRGARRILKGDFVSITTVKKPSVISSNIPTYDGRRINSILEQHLATA